MSIPQNPSPRFLLISESAVDRALADRVLRDQVTAVSDAEAALAAVERQGFVAILLDHAIRGSDPADLLSRLRAAGNTAPVVLLTEPGEDAGAVLRQGAIGCLVKESGYEAALAALGGPLAAAAARPDPTPATIGSVEGDLTRDLTGDLTDLVVVEVGGQTHAFCAAAVREVLPALTVTPLPASPPEVEGLIDLRGRQVVVIDVRPALGLPRKAMDQSDHLIVAMGDDGSPIALHVDRAVTILRAAVMPLESGGRFGRGERVARLANGFVPIHHPDDFRPRAVVTPA